MGLLFKRKEEEMSLKIVGGVSYLLARANKEMMDWYEMNIKSFLKKGEEILKKEKNEKKKES
jgi:precorrin-6B methylase 1